MTYLTIKDKFVNIIIFFKIECTNHSNINPSFPLQKLSELDLG